MTVRAYCRCNSGHYFEGAYCPFDGWSSPESMELADAVARLSGAGSALSVGALCQVGVSNRTIARIIVIEFGCEASSFEAISPEGYIIHGTWRPLASLDTAHL